MDWLALDIGGANVKVADGRDFAASYPFPLWQQSRKLAELLRTVIAESPAADHVAATMTGELCDCFATKAEGVRFILDALVTASDGRHARIYQTNGLLVSPQVASRNPLLVAAANWHVLARFAGKFAPRGTGLLIDIGSTTCDIIPLVDGRPAAEGATDPERLLSGELVYTGVERSPVCALVSTLLWRKQQCPVAQEVFATSWDAYLTLGDLPDEPDSAHEIRPTAEGPRKRRPAIGWPDRSAPIATCSTRKMPSAPPRRSLAARRRRLRWHIVKSSDGSAAYGATGRDRDLRPGRIFGPPCAGAVASGGEGRFAQR